MISSASSSEHASEHDTERLGGLSPSSSSLQPSNESTCSCLNNLVSCILTSCIQTCKCIKKCVQKCVQKCVSSLLPSNPTPNLSTPSGHLKFKTLYPLPSSKYPSQLSPLECERMRSLYSTFQPTSNNNSSLTLNPEGENNPPLKTMNPNPLL